MYKFFVPKESIKEENIVLQGSDVNHIRNVLRMRVGEKIIISDGIDKEYKCEIIDITEEDVMCKILDVDGMVAELPSKIYLLQGLPKMDKMELIIQKAVELGVYEIIPVATKRAVVKLDEKKSATKVKRWNSISESAAKQSKRSIIPKVSEVVSFKQAVDLIKDFDTAIIPYEQETNILESKKIFDQIKEGTNVAIMIGPEGGFSDSEIKYARENNVKPISLGKRILRTETAGLMVLSVIMWKLEKE